MLVGGCVFVVRVPERWRPGAFDVWGHSHQVFHLCAVVGAMCHFMALLKGYEYRKVNSAC